MTSPSSRKRQSLDDVDISPPPSKRVQQSTTTKKAVANFFKPASQKEPEQVTWRIVDGSLLVGRYHARDAEGSSKKSEEKKKIAAFDLDSTLIKTKGGQNFARDAHDWQWWDAIVPTILRRLYSEGYQIVIISNQAGISLKTNSKFAQSDMKSLSNLKNKVSKVVTQLDLPVSIYAATEKDKYRKPRVGMWEQMLDDYRLDPAEDVDLQNSIFVGDAAGRAERSRAGFVLKKDHSCSDRNLAANVGISFKTPEEFFLKEATEPMVRAFDPASYLIAPDDRATDAPRMPFKKANDAEIVLFSGSPGSGKSTFYWKNLQPLGYERVNQDILKSREKCLKVAAAHLEEGKSVAIDNTNADRATRAQWITLAKKHNLPIRCIHFTASPQLCEHNDTVRALNINTMNPEKRSLLPSSAFYSFAKRWEEPKLEEGFEEIVAVEFAFDGTDEERSIWGKYWT